MADMATVNDTIDGKSYAFKLLEADIPTLTYGAAPNSGPVPDTFAVLMSLLGVQDYVRVDQYGISRGVLVDSQPILGIFYDLLVPKCPSVNWSMPTAKSQLAAAANALSGTTYGRPIEVRATLAMALKGGGMSLASAVDAADMISRSSSRNPAAGRMSYVANTLVPQILNAAAAA